MSGQRESQRFHEDTVVVTGSTRGIGAEIARQFAGKGAAVVITGRSTADWEAVVNSIKESGGNAVFIRADIQSPDDIATLFEATTEEFGGVDVLINSTSEV